MLSPLDSNTTISACTLTQISTKVKMCKKPELMSMHVTLWSKLIFKYCTFSDPNQNSNFFIGATDAQNQQNWTWIQSNSQNYFSWKEYQPNGLDGDYPEEIAHCAAYTAAYGIVDEIAIKRNCLFANIICSMDGAWVTLYVEWKTGTTNG